MYSKLTEWQLFCVAMASGFSRNYSKYHVEQEKCVKDSYREKLDLIGPGMDT